MWAEDLKDRKIILNAKASRNKRVITATIVAMNKIVAL